MPPQLKLKPVNSLTEILVKFVSKYLHATAKVCAKLKRAKKLSEQNLTAIRGYFSEVSHCVPASIYEDFIGKLQALILAEKILLDEVYYDVIGGLLNRFTKNLILDKASMFQDSSMAIEAFLQHLPKARNAKKLIMTKSVIDIIDYEFEPSLMQIATFTDLQTLKLPGLKHIDVDTDAMAEFLQLLQNNCLHLTALELNESNIDNECCNIIGEIHSLTQLNLNHCPKLESLGVLHLLKKLTKLTKIEALRGKSSNVQNALDILAAENNNYKIANLKHMTFRDPHGIAKVAPLCPGVEELRVIYNVYEFGYEASVDKCLVDLNKFSNELSINAELNCLNMLFVIQWRNLPQWGPSLKRLALTEPEFLHPQTLNPFALQCNNLTEISIVNPSTISDDLFVGRVPELARRPFHSLKKVTFEGEKLPIHVAKFLLGSASMLEELTIIVDILQQDNFQGIMNILSETPRNCINKTGFYFSKYEETEETELQIKVSDSLQEFVLQHLSLSWLALYVRLGNAKLKEDIYQLEKSLKMMNWDIVTNFEINIPRGK